MDTSKDISKETYGLRFVYLSGLPPGFLTIAVGGSNDKLMTVEPLPLGAMSLALRVGGITNRCFVLSDNSLYYKVASLQ